METRPTDCRAPDERPPARRGAARVTVVVPCYNQAHFLPECLESVVRQTLEDWEAIVVDDASPDGSDIRGVVESFGDPRIRLHVHETNLGLGGARNTGIREATTGFVLPLDADDRIASTCLQRMVAHLEADADVDCVYADVQLFGRTNDVLEFPGPAAGAKMLRAEDTIPGAGTMMRRELWERLGGYDENDVLRKGREDFEFWIRAFDAGCRAGRIREPLYDYRILHSSMNISCRLQDDAIARYIYGKHKQLFDDAGETTRFLCFWTDKAATASYEQGMRKRAVELALKSWRMEPTRARLKGVMRTFLPYSVNHAIASGELRRRVPFVGYPLHGRARHRPFFVIGVRRSGDALLRGMLTSHSQLHVPPETFVLGQCIRKFKTYGRKLNWPDLVAFMLAQFEFHPDFHLFKTDLQPLAARFSYVPKERRNLADLLDALYRFHAESHGLAPVRWGDKTPINSLDDATIAGRAPNVPGAGVPETLERLLRVFPDAQFLHVYRDGCDLVYSHVRGGLESRIDEAAKRWLHVERQTRRFAQRRAAQSVDVRFEDLVANPEGTLRGVCSFLGVEFEPAMLLDGDSRYDEGEGSSEVGAFRSTSGPTSRPSLSTNPGHPGQPGQGRRNFSAAEKDELQRLIGAELAELGYPPVTREPDRP